MNEQLNLPGITPAPKKYRVRLRQDISPEDPRQWCNMGTMVCFHKRYRLGDNNHGYDSSDYNSWQELRDQIVKDHNPVEMYPLYMYDHSGITIRTTPFSCPWDSGQVGWIFVARETAKRELGFKRNITKKRLAQIQKILLAEVETYDCYLRGDTFGFELELFDYESETWEHEDSCWGFYGDADKVSVLDYLAYHGVTVLPDNMDEWLEVEVQPS